MTAGDLSQRVAIYRKVTTDDGQGGRSTAPEAVATGVPACVKPWETQQDETRQVGAVMMHRRFRVWVRYRAGITAAMWLSWRPFRETTAVVLEIVAVSPVPSRDFLQIDCVERTAA